MYFMLGSYQSSKSKCTLIECSKAKVVKIRLYRDSVLLNGQSDKKGKALISCPTF